MAARLVEKEHLSAKGLIQKAKNVFQKVKEPPTALKEEGYHFEHNFGRGYKNLSTVFAMLMMLAFLIDQTEQLCCGLFQGVLGKLKSKKSRLWRYIREFFDTYIIPSREVLYRSIIHEDSRKIPILDSS